MPAKAFFQKGFLESGNSFPGGYRCENNFSWPSPTHSRTLAEWPRLTPETPNCCSASQAEDQARITFRCSPLHDEAPIQEAVMPSLPRKEARLHGSVDGCASWIIRNSGKRPGWAQTDRVCLRVADATVGKAACAKGPPWCCVPAFRCGCDREGKRVRGGRRRQARDTQ